MADNVSFDLQTQQVLLDFYCLMPPNSDSSFENIQNNGRRDDSFGSIPKSALSFDGAPVGLTLIKMNNKVLMYRPFSTPSSARSSSHSQNSHHSSSNQSLRGKGDVFFDNVDAPKKDDSISSDSTKPSVDELRGACKYVDIREEKVQEAEELSKEIEIVLWEQRQDEVRKLQRRGVVSTPKPKQGSNLIRVEMGFDSPLSGNDEEEDDNEEVESGVKQVGVRLRVIGDQVQRQYSTDIASAIDHLIGVLTEETAQFEANFFAAIERLVPIVGYGWNAVAMIITISQRVLMASVSSLRLVMSVASRAINHFEGAFIQQQGGWEVVNSIEDVEFVESSVDTPPSNNKNNNN